MDRKAGWTGGFFFEKSKSTKIERSNALKTCGKIGIERKIFMFISFIFQNKKRTKQKKERKTPTKRIMGTKRKLRLVCWMYARACVWVLSECVLRLVRFLSPLLSSYSFLSVSMLFRCWRSFIRGCDLHFAKRD